MSYNVIFIGLGGLCRTLLYCLPHILPNFKINRALFIEPRDIIQGVDIPLWLIGKYQHLKISLTKENHKKVLNKIREAYYINFIIDLSVGVGALQILDYSMKNGIHYINTSLEDWKGDNKWNGKSESMIEHSLQHHEKKAFKYKDKGRSCVINCGMNPGIVSLFIKLGIDEVCKRNRIYGGTYADRAQRLGLEVVHISERDTCKPLIKKKKNVFVNTWSCIGFEEEALDSVQLGWGSHEKGKIKGSVEYGNQLLLPVRAVDMKARSYEPKGGKIEGLLVPHDENNSICDFLSVGKYKPSVYYVYKSCDISVKSLNEVRNNDYKYTKDYHILESREIKSGYDSVGVLMMFKDKKSFCVHTIVDNDFAMKLSLFVNATLIQTTAGVICAIDHILKHMNSGVCLPEDIEHYSALRLVRPLLGELYIGEVNFKPKSNQFSDFLVR